MYLFQSPMLRPRVVDLLDANQTVIARKVAALVPDLKSVQVYRGRPSVNTATGPMPSWTLSSRAGYAEMEFTEEPSEEDKAAIVDLLRAFDGTNPRAYKLYKFAKNPAAWDDWEEEPFDVDFKSALKFTLAKKVLPKVKGRPTKVEYYEKSYDQLDQFENPVLDPTTGQPVRVYENLIAEIDFTLIYDSDGLIKDRSLKLYWYREDGTKSTQYKELGRGYDAVLDKDFRVSEGQQRRRSVVNTLSAILLEWMKGHFALGMLESDIVDLHKAWFETHQSAFSLYLETGSPKINNDIASDPSAWLDEAYEGMQTVRDFLLEELTD